MNWSVVQRILGLLLMMFSITMLPPVLVSLFYQDGSLVTIYPGLRPDDFRGFYCLASREEEAQGLAIKRRFSRRRIFLDCLGTFGAAPLFLSDILDLSLTDALFESMSGLTTTGATILSGLDGLPRSLLYYRQQLQWLGGMGIIVLAVAVLPMLGVGGMQLYRAENARSR